MRQIIKIKIVLAALIVLFTYTQCTNPYSAQPSKLKFSSGEDAGALSTSTSVAAFENSVYKVTRSRCIGCHSSQNPVHASDDVQEAHDIVVDQFKVNFSNIPSSRLVAKMRDEAHNCWSDCAENAQEMEEAIEQWAEIVNSIVEEEEEEENTDDGNGDGSTGSDGTDETIISGLSSQEAFEQSVYPITKQRCTTCHITRFPRHANANPVVAHNDIVSAQSVDLDDPMNSRLVQRLGNESHQCWSNCADNANEMKEAIERWKSLMVDRVIANVGENSTALSGTVSTVISTNPVPGNAEAGYMEFELSNVLGVNESVTLRVKISEFDEFSYQVWDPEIISSNYSIRVKNMKTYINGYYNPQHSVYTIVDTTTTPSMRSISSYYLLALKDQGINTDQFSFSFEILSIVEQ